MISISIKGNLNALFFHNINQQKFNGLIDIDWQVHLFYIQKTIYSWKFGTNDLKKGKLKNNVHNVLKK